MYQTGQHAVPDGAGPLVRPYAMTHGRTRPSSDNFDLIALVVAADVPTPTVGLEPEHHVVLRLAQQPISVAEIAAHADLPVGVVRILLDDLRAGGCVQVKAPMSVAKMPNTRVLRAVINGLRAL
ncbi:DUF742 domain-containing protein [Actinocatenispora rupis]|uniref:DUF742 domain-containing protein n=1 Tax=Actinocatenispora rupis TaxID=519421 RepID=A0A8J3J546_9ACTN|nr:DUF742 domain-containing protein [Actinocatenispora rupis]GID10302.1 hypothetical protein Aru02nite_11910 [Actinocatenispora rupis]